MKPETHWVFYYIDSYGNRIIHSTKLCSDPENTKNFISLEKYFKCLPPRLVGGDYGYYSIPSRKFADDILSVWYDGKKIIHKSGDTFIINANDQFDGVIEKVQDECYTFCKANNLDVLMPKVSAAV